MSNPQHVDGDPTINKEDAIEQDGVRNGGLSFRFSPEMILQLIEKRIEMDDTHFNNPAVTSTSAWTQLITALGWPGLTKNAAEKRWKNCTRQYRKYSQQLRADGGDENHVHQKTPSEWIKRLERWYSTRRSHRPAFIMDTAATQLEKKGQQADVEDGFGGALSLTRAAERNAGSNELLVESQRRTEIVRIERYDFDSSYFGNDSELF
ncbi:uncharacterized protein LOC141850044 [Brevipalpus obovatus]|uniref:uncharacterized protein LOC141850044 n=1 Tax=Brevipalpus obovatus TaxID=246614 RepID=UPI003D9F4C68